MNHIGWLVFSGLKDLAFILGFNRFCFIETFQKIYVSVLDGEDEVKKNMH